MGKRAWIAFGILVGVFVVAIAFRLYGITDYPPGLFPDQAANGEDALLILQGDIRPFYERNNGREAVFFYIQALFIGLFGVGVWPMFAASALVGILTVVAVYCATRVWFGKLAGTLAAFFLATSYWHVTISRTGFRAVMIPLFIAAFTAFAGYAIEAVRKQKISRSYVYAALAAASFSLGFYTYIAYRMMVGVVLGVFVLLLLAALHPKIGFPHMKRYGKQLAVAIIAGLIVAAPLALYFIQHPSSVMGRAGQVSVFDPALQQQFGGGTLVGTVWYSTRETLLSFFVGTGDMNWRHSVAGYPLVNPLVGILFLLGFAWALSGVGSLFFAMGRGREIHYNMVYAYLLLLFFGMLVPVVTSAEGIPHALRSVGLFVPMFILAGVAGAVLLRWLFKQGGDAWRAVVLGVALGLLAVNGLYDGALYFLMARNDSDAYVAYRGDLTEVATWVNEYRGLYAADVRPYVAVDGFSAVTVHYLTSVAAHDDASHPDEAQHKYILLEPTTSHLTSLQSGEVIIFAQSSMRDADRYAAKWGEQIELLLSKKNRFGQEVLRVYRGKGSADASGEQQDLDAG